MVLSTFKCVRSKRGASLLLRAGALTFVALSLAGCTDRLATGSAISDDYQARHPISVRERAVTLNLFPGRKLDAASRRRVVEFASDLRAEGARTVEILIPAGAPNQTEARAAIPMIEAALREGGSTASVSIGSYPAADPQTFSPVRLSYRGLTARVAHSCGQWPADLASGSTLETWENRPYWNFGCSYQNMIATQLDDPRDLEAPRAASPSDVQMRTRAIGKVREGVDPATAWSDKTISVGASK